MSLVGRCKDQEILDEAGGTIPEIPFLGGLEEVMIKSSIPEGYGSHMRTW